MDTGNVDMAKTMAEVFSIGDINKDEKLSKVEFVQVRINQRAVFRSRDLD